MKKSISFTKTFDPKSEFFPVIGVNRFERYTTGEDTFAIEYQKPAKRAGDFSVILQCQASTGPIAPHRGRGRA
jgi:hypothetical protein